MVVVGGNVPATMPGKGGEGQRPPPGSYTAGCHSTVPAAGLAGPEPEQYIACDFYSTLADSSSILIKYRGIKNRNRRI